MTQVFQDVTQVGEGHFGKVYRVVSREDDQVYAIKVSKDTFHNDAERYVLKVMFSCHFP